MSHNPTQWTPEWADAARQTWGSSMTTKAEIREWLREGLMNGKTHVLVVCDTFDHSDYPVFIDPDEDAHTVAQRYDGNNMQRLMEVYNLSLSIEDQLKQVRVFNY